MKRTDLAESTQAFVRHVLGDTKGFLVTYTARQKRLEVPEAPGGELVYPDQRSWQYPDRLGDAVDYLRAGSEKGRDAYFAVVSYKEDGNRRNTNAAEVVSCLWLDYDGYKGSRPEGFPDPTAYVTSSPGSYHMYFKLSRPMPKQEAVGLNRRLARWAGMDRSLAAITTVLRVPGTINYKRHPDLHEVTGEITGVEPYDPDEFEALLPPTPSQPEPEYDGPANAGFDLEDWLEDHEEANASLIEARHDDAARTKYAVVCPWVDEHTAGDESGSYLGQFPDGALFFHCHHGHCDGRGWQEYRRFYEEDSMNQNVVDLPGVTKRDTRDTPDSYTRSGQHALPPPEPFPVDALPPAMARLVSEAAASMGITPDFCAVFALTVMGSAAGTSRRLHLSNEWSEYPAIWTCVVGTPGDKKTPSLKIASKPAYAEQKSLDRKHREALEEYKREIAGWKERKSQAKKGVFKEPEPEKPEAKHLYVQDVTIEKLAEMLQHEPRGLLAAWDELSGFFSGMDQYKSGGQGSERSKYLSMWSGSALKVDRKGDEPVYADPALVGVTGGIQPDILPEIGRRGPGSVKGDDGMVHRFLFCYPERSVVLADLTGYDVSPVTSLHYGFLYDQLRNLEHHENGEPVTVRFTPEGEAAFDRHNRAIRAEMYRPGFPKTLQGTWPKLASSQLARLSLLFSLCRVVWNDEPETVTEEDVEGAVRVIDYFKSHARRAHFALYPETEEERLLQAVGDLLAERDDHWRATLPEIRDALQAKLDEWNVATNLPERNDELTKELLRIGETDDSLSVKRGKLHDGRSRALVLRAVHGARLASGSVPDVPASDTLPPVGNGEKLVEYQLRTGGPMFPAEIAEQTRLAHRTVKNVLSRLRQVPHPRVEDTGKTDEHGSNQVRLIERDYGANTPPI
jgi:hypothetical protein